jgi:NAD(P)-dependent dehydrogenase (short-subunit alcohol dehydrogenase family)
VQHNLAGKVVLITGAGGGIGFATARAFLDEGAYVVGGDLDPGPLAALGDDRVLPVEADLRDPYGARRLAQAALDRFGRVDVLHNNAGVATVRPGGFLGVEDDAWRDVLELNLLGYVRMARAVLGARHAADWGRPELEDLEQESRRVILASAHRRDAWPQLSDIARAWRRLADRGDVRVVIPLHRNPAVREAILPVVAGHPDITVTDPLPYLSFCRLLDRADMIISDSSGAQEEGPALGTPTLVLADVTERVETIETGAARLVGKTTEGIVEAAVSLLDDSAAYTAMARAVNPYGDGYAAERTVGALAHYFGLGPAPSLFAPESSLVTGHFPAGVAQLAG